jgi:hypothetical protein
MALRGADRPVDTGRPAADRQVDMALQGADRPVDTDRPEADHQVDTVRREADRPEGTGRRAAVLRWVDRRATAHPGARQATGLHRAMGLPGATAHRADP